MIEYPQRVGGVMSNKTQDLNQKLLKDRRVVEEISRHMWIESERAGYDIGFDQAAEDWLKKFSKAWINYHMPKAKKTKS